MFLCLHPTLQTKAMLQHETKAHESHTPYKRSKVVQHAIEMSDHATKVVLTPCNIKEICFTTRGQVQ
jgi:hypothetical protein